MKRIILASASPRRKELLTQVGIKFEVIPMTEKQILSYIAKGDCMDKAGGYGIQGCFAEHIKGIVGDYYNVVGLPISELMRNLRPLHYYCKINA